MDPTFVVCGIILLGVFLVGAYLNLKLTVKTRPGDLRKHMHKLPGED